MTIEDGATSYTVMRERERQTDYYERVPSSYQQGDPCTLCPVADHRDDEHPECDECGGTYEPLNDERVCLTCVYEDSLIELDPVGFLTDDLMGDPWEEHSQYVTEFVTRALRDRGPEGTAY